MTNKTGNGWSVEGPVLSIDKPPLGLKPKSIHDQLRTLELLDAMRRYCEEGLPIPIEWLNEFNEKIEENNILEKKMTNKMPEVGKKYRTKIDALFPDCIIKVEGMNIVINEAPYFSYNEKDFWGKFEEIEESPLDLEPELIKIPKVGKKYKYKPKIDGTIQDHIVKIKAINIMFSEATSDLAIRRCLKIFPLKEFWNRFEEIKEQPLDLKQKSIQLIDKIIQANTDYQKMSEFYYKAYMSDLIETIAKQVGGEIKIGRGCGGKESIWKTFSYEKLNDFIEQRAEIIKNLSDELDYNDIAMLEPDKFCTLIDFVNHIKSLEERIKQLEKK